MCESARSEPGRERGSVRESERERGCVKAGLLDGVITEGSKKISDALVIRERVSHLLWIRGFD